MDDLLAAFSGVSLDNRQAVVAQFSRVLGTDEQTASFFLESHQNDIARAVDAYLALSAGNKATAMIAQTGAVPSGVFENDSSWDPRQFGASRPFALARRIQNNGTVRWPDGMEIAQADGNLSIESIPIKSADPQEITGFELNFWTPAVPGTYTASLRLRSPLHGFCSEEIWLILEVVPVETQTQTEMQMQPQLQVPTEALMQQTDVDQADANMEYDMDL